MRVIVVGLGVQGAKRRAVAGEDIVATVDPIHQEADYRSVTDVPIDDYDAALVCVPDQAKDEVLNHLIGHGKHSLVEKPLLFPDEAPIEALAALGRENNTLCYTAYNHRFEPHYVRMKALLDSGELGRIYSVRMFYGNGTARLVRASPWRDQGAGVLADLGSHLLDTLLFWFGDVPDHFDLWSANRFENKAFDHFSFGAQPSGGLPLMQLEASLLAWRNHFTADIYGEAGSAHISSLCKWGPTSFIKRTRVLPSGRPEEDKVDLEQPDPTWALEYEHFKNLVAGSDPAAGSNLANDIRINRILNAVGAVALAGGGR